jgi:CheY-like chemotaxis protein
MPRMTGLELLQVLRGEPAWRSVPVLAMSGYPEARFPGLRADAFLQKPFEIPALEALVDRLCGTVSTAATG